MPAVATQEQPADRGPPLTRIRHRAGSGQRGARVEGAVASPRRAACRWRSSVHLRRAARRAVDEASLLLPEICRLARVAEQDPNDPAPGPDQPADPLPSPWPPEGSRTPEQQQQVEAWERAVAWLEGKWRREDGHAAPCPYCQTRSWSVGVPTMPASFTGGAWAGASAFFPVMCLNCGNTVQVSADLVGNKPPWPPDPVPDQGT